jgi:hypothetical protein
MTGGTISGNKANGGASPHGGGGVYVAGGAFEMDGGAINGNYSVRQGGGVFVWHNALFNASGSASILNNDGVGSSKDMCSRGYTELMGGAQTGRVYVWNNNDEGYKFSQERDSFTISGNAMINTGVVLAYDDSKTLPQTRNYINIDSLMGSGTMTIDLEGHLTNYKFATMDLEPDWLGKTLIKTNNAADIDRFTLGSFVGSGTRLLSSYKINKVGLNGVMVRK